LLFVAKLRSELEKIRKELTFLEPILDELRRDEVKGKSIFDTVRYSFSWREEELMYCETVRQLEQGQQLILFDFFHSYLFDRQ
jgi:hypothetical protein